MLLGGPLTPEIDAVDTMAASVTVLLAIQDVAKSSSKSRIC
jgi:hypothetical protein